MQPLQGAFGLFLVTHGPATDANTEYQRGLNAITAAERVHTALHKLTNAFSAANTRHCTHGMQQLL